MACVASSRSQCKHQLAARLGSLLGRVAVAPQSDVDLARLLMQHCA
jgi:hypothetical protein